MAAGEAWDGKLEVEDYTSRFAIGGGLDVNGFREKLSMQMKETVNLSLIHISYVNRVSNLPLRVVHSLFILF